MGYAMYSLFALALISGQAPSTVAEIESAALAHRRAVRTAYVVVACETEEKGDPANRRRKEATFWMDGDRLRVDHFNHDPSLGAAAGRRQVEGVNCEWTGYVLQYDNVPRVVARLAPRSQAIAFPAYPTFDPRLLGYLPDWFVHHRTGRLDSHVGAADRTGLRVEKDRLDGIDCWVVRFERENGKVKGRIWYDPNRGYHPVRFDYQSMIGKGDRLKMGSTTTRITLQRVGELWFPRTVQVSQSLGDKVIGRETVEVKEVRLNDPIPPAVFTLAGIGVPDDTFFDIVGKRPRDWVWSGGRLVPYTQYRQRWDLDVVPVPVPLVSPARPRYWLYALAGALVVAAVTFLWRAVRGRTT